MTKNSTLRDVGVAYALANLWFLRSWKRLLYKGDGLYFSFEPHSIFEYAAIFLDVVLMTFMFLALMKLANFQSLRIRCAFRVIFLFTGLCAFGALSTELITWVSPTQSSLINLPVPLIILGLCLALSQKPKLQMGAVITHFKTVSILLLPFSLLLLVQALWAAAFIDPKPLLPQSIESQDMESLAIGQRAASPPLAKKVVWIIFDELDYAALTSAGKNGIVLPDVERLMNESFVADNAFAPHDSTGTSIPTLLTGKALYTVRPIAPNDLILYPRDKSRPVTLRASHNIVSATRDMGGEIGIVGWYHPYPRIFKEKVSSAFWSSSHSARCPTLKALPACSMNIFIESLANIPLASDLFPSLKNPALKNAASEDETYERQLQRHRFLNDKANRLISNPALNLLFFHFSVPHTPYIGRGTEVGNESYFDSLQVVNDTLKRLRKTPEASGHWDDTTLIVSSDHHWRFKTAENFSFLPSAQQQNAVNDIRIPYIIKIVGQKTSVNYKPPFNTIITKELIVALL